MPPVAPARRVWFRCLIFLTAGLAAAGCRDRTDEGGDLDQHVGALSAALTAVDVGAVGIAGTYVEAGGKHTMEGAGGDIWGGADAFRFAYQALSGDGTITARVISLENTQASAKAGVMMRESLAVGSKNVLALLTPTVANGYRFQSRSTTGGTTIRPTSGTGVAPRLLRITRVGNSFTGYESPDGSAWATLGPAVSIPMPTTIVVGLAVCSHVPGNLATAVFDSVSITQPTTPPPPPPPSQWTSQDIGSVGATGSSTEASGKQTVTVKGAGADIYGNADAFRFVHQAVTGDATIVARIDSLTATNSWTKAVVMIREDVTPGARNVAVVLSPTAVNKYRVQSRAAAAGSTASVSSSANSAVPSWLKLERAGTAFRAYNSSNGTTWIQIGGTITVAMAASVRIGIGITSHTGNTLATGVFSGVSITTAAPPPTVDAAVPIDGAPPVDAAAPADLAALVDVAVPDDAAPAPVLVVDGSELIFSAIRATRSVTRALVVRNAGTSPLQVAAPTIVGVSPAVFVFETTAPATIILAPGAQTSVRLVFAPSATALLGTHHAVLRLTSNDPDRPLADVDLWGLATKGSEGANEPPLKQVIDTLGYAIDVGGTALVLGIGPDPIGDEVRAPRFRRAGPGLVTMKPVARYSPDEPIPYGLYVSASGVQTLGIIDRGQFQTLLPTTQAGAIAGIDPGEGTFGVTCASATHATFSEDALNTGTVKHAVRSYPLKNRAGQLIPNTYLVGFEEAANGDYQDYVFVLGNVVPVLP
jgi:hypothetical protein